METLFRKASVLQSIPKQMVMKWNAGNGLPLSPTMPTAGDEQ